MTWKTIRLQLARTPKFPQGSAAHAYVLRLPIDDNGMIERGEMIQPRVLWSAACGPMSQIEPAW